MVWDFFKNFENFGVKIGYLGLLLDFSEDQNRESNARFVFLIPPPPILTLKLGSESAKLSERGR